MNYHNSEEFKKEQFLKTLDMIEFNGHLYVDGDYQKKESPLTVFCLTHQVEHHTTFTNYRRSKTGMPCCGKASVSKKLTQREYTLETLDKMKQAARNRIRPASTGQNWRRSTEARRWEKQVRDIWNNECAITGNKVNLVMHHFYSGARCAENNLKLRNTLLYNPSNGILLNEKFHVDFHKKFRYTENTIDQFQTYIQTLITSISSQAQQECWEGSETRVYDLSLLPTLQLKKIMKLHERLEEIKLRLPAVTLMI